MGPSPAKVINPPVANIPTLKPAKTLSMIWPAIIFANKRTDSVIGRDKNDIISIGKISGISQAGTPGGKNKLKKCKPCL